MKEEIIQIIPAPDGMKAYYEDETVPKDKQGRASAHAIPVCCLALVKVKDKDGVTHEIRPMIMLSDGYAEFASESGNFVAVDYE